MNKLISLSILSLLTAVASAGDQQLFNGKDLSGWEGQPGWWTVEDGAITSESTPDKPCHKATYLVWEGGEPADFELTLEFKLSPEHNKSNSGVQIRSERRPNWDTFGYQADMTATGNLTGFVYHHARGLIAARGEKVTISPEGKRDAQKLDGQDAINAAFKPGEWNRYRIVCDGPDITLYVNGVLVCEFSDHDAKQARSKGIIALQMHPGPPMKVQFKNIMLKTLGAASEEEALLEILKSDADVVEKRETCRELTRIGTAAAVPVLAELLSDDTLSHMARRVLEAIPAPEADEALRAAVPTVEGEERAGILHTIGQRGDQNAVPLLAKELISDDPAVANAAARALGRIGSEAAVDALQASLSKGAEEHQTVLWEALVDAAEGLEMTNKEAAIAVYESLRENAAAPESIRVAALRAAILLQGREGLSLLQESIRSEEDWAVSAAASAALHLNDPAVALMLAKSMEGQPVERQILLAGLLGDLGDAKVLPILLSLETNSDPSLRLAIVHTVTQIGGADAVAPLLAWMTDSDAGVAKAAAAGLAGLEGEAVNRVVLELLTRRDHALQLTLIEIAAQRGMDAALPVLAERMNDADSSIRLAAIKAYGDLSNVEQLSVLLKTIQSRSDDADIQALGKIIAKVCIESSDPKQFAPQISAAHDAATPEAQAMLAKVLKRVQK